MQTLKALKTWSIGKKELNNVIKALGKVVKNKTSCSALQNILIDFDNGYIYGSELKTFIRVVIPRQYNIVGSVLVPFKEFKDIVSSLGADIMMSVEDNILKLSDGSITMSIQCGDVAEYIDLKPYLDPGEFEYFVISSATLKSVAKCCKYASSDVTRQILTGVNLKETSDLCFNAAATDGHRLTVSENILISGGIAKPITIPANLLSIADSLASKSSEVEFKVFEKDDDQFVVIEFDHITLSTKLLKGQYPNYKQLIPKQFSKSVKLNAKLLKEKLEKLIKIAKAKKIPAIVAFEFNSGIAKLSTKNKEIELEMNLAFSDIPEPFNINFNAEYLLDFTKDGTLENLKLNMNKDKNSAVIVNSLDSTGLIMPVQFRN